MSDETKLPGSELAKLVEPYLLPYASDAEIRRVLMPELAEPLIKMKAQDYDERIAEIRRWWDAAQEGRD